MVQAAIKTIAMVALSVLAFMANPMAFPFVLVTFFLIWATPYAIAAFLQRDDDSVLVQDFDSIAEQTQIDVAAPMIPPVAAADDDRLGLGV